MAIEDAKKMKALKEKALKNLEQIGKAKSKEDFDEKYIKSVTEKANAVVQSVQGQHYLETKKNEKGETVNTQRELFKNSLEAGRKAWKPTGMNSYQDGKFSTTELMSNLFLLVEYGVAERDIALAQFRANARIALATFSYTSDKDYKYPDLQFSVGLDSAGKLDIKPLTTSVKTKAALSLNSDMQDWFELSTKNWLKQNGYEEDLDPKTKVGLKTYSNNGVKLTAKKLDELNMQLDTSIAKYAREALDNKVQFSETPSPRPY